MLTELLTKVQLKMGLNLQPDQQRVIVVASQIPFETADLTEAAEVVFGRVAGIGGDELLNEAVEILQPAECYYYEERRRRKEWGPPVRRSRRSSSTSPLMSVLGSRWPSSSLA